MYRCLLNIAASLLATLMLLAGQCRADDVSRQDLAAVEIQVPSGYLGKWYTEDDDETRILLLRVSVKNRHSELITVARSDWKLTA